MNLYMYIYTYIYVHIHIYVYVHIYVYRAKCFLESSGCRTLNRKPADIEPCLLRDTNRESTLVSFSWYKASKQICIELNIHHKEACRAVYDVCISIYIHIYI